MRPLPLGVRNRLGELILEAFEQQEARRTLEALARYCAGTEPVALPEEPRASLRPLDWFEEIPDQGAIRLKGAHRPYREALCRRIEAARDLLSREGGEPGGPSLQRVLARAGRLFDAGLYFEVHELLEPHWMRADGAERRALQGLIQVAVAFHHQERGNREGAISLLAEGLAKLEGAERAFPLPLAGWRQALADGLAELRAGGSAPAPPFPVPLTEPAWRSS